MITENQRAQVRQAIEISVLPNSEFKGPLLRAADKIGRLKGNFLLLGSYNSEIKPAALTSDLAKINRTLSDEKIDCQVHVAYGYGGVKCGGILISSGLGPYERDLRIIADSAMPRL